MPFYFHVLFTSISIHQPTLAHSALSHHPQTQGGDIAFPLDTLQGTYFDEAGKPDPRVTVRQWGNGQPPATPPSALWETSAFDLNHNVFIFNPDVMNWVVDTVSRVD